MGAQIIDEPSIRRVEGRGGSVDKAGGEEQHEEDRTHCVKQCTGRSADFASLIYLPSVEQQKYTVPHGDSAVLEIQSLLSFLGILSSKAVGETPSAFLFGLYRLRVIRKQLEPGFRLGFSFQKRLKFL